MKLGCSDCQLGRCRPHKVSPVRVWSRKVLRSYWFVVAFIKGGQR
jgi:hypothetical protein